METSWNIKGIRGGLLKFSCLDPFQPIDPLINQPDFTDTTQAIASVVGIGTDILKGYEKVEVDDEWMRTELDKNIF